MVRLYSLGECAIDVGGVRVRPDSEVLFALLLYLAVERGRRVPRSRFIELFWPREDDERARHNLRQAIYKAKQLGAAIGQEEGDIVLPASAAWADYDALLGGDDGDRSVDESDAVEFLPSYAAVLSEVFADWVDDRRAIVHSALRRRLVGQLTRARRLARWKEVERHARRVLALDPMNEEAVIGHAEATAVAGSRALAASILDRYLADLGPNATLLGRPAHELRRRILEANRDEPQLAALFVGRDADLSFLVEALDRAVGGVGGAVHVWGPPGIGKSALLRRLIDVARLRGASIARVYGQYASSPQPLAMYTALVEELLQLPGALGCAPQALDYCRLLSGSRAPDPSGPLIDPDLLRNRIQDSVVELARAIAEEAPLLVGIEDVHWADEQSLERLTALAHALRDVRVLFVFTGRHPLGHGWPEPAASMLTVRELSGLSRDAAEQLLVSRLGKDGDAPGEYVSWCIRVSEGHPLYLRELGDRWRLHGERYDMPPSLATLLTTRLASLSPPALRTLQLCALLGRASTLPRLERALSLNLRAFTAVVEELEIAELVCAESGAFVITHDMLSDAALARAPQGTRRLLHKQVALVLEEELATTLSPSTSWHCAQHWLRAGEQDRAGIAVHAAAARFIAIGMPGDASALLRSFLETTIEGTQRESSIRLLIEADNYMGKWRDVLAFAATVSPAKTTGTVLHDAAELHAREAAWRSEDKDLRSLLYSAERCVNAATATTEHRATAAYQGLIFADYLFDADAMDRLHRAISSDRGKHAEVRLSTARAQLVYHSVRGDLNHAVQLARYSVELAEVSGNPMLLTRCLRNALIPLRYAAQFADALMFATRAVEISTSTGSADLIASSMFMLAMLHLAIEQYSEAEHLSDRAQVYIGRTDPQHGRAYVEHAASVIAFYQGDLERATTLSARHATPIESYPTRHGTDLLASRVIRTAYSEQRDVLEGELARLAERLRFGGSWGSHDYVAAALAYGLKVLDRENDAGDAVASYLSSRRERYPMPAAIPLLT